GANLMGECQVCVARENHQFSAHRSPEHFSLSKMEILSYVVVSTAGIGGRILEPTTLMRSRG
ncbi:MAG TPA: hypothetical protein VFQ06_05400, partial [Nitrospira sp.]|nr:hypothetical protein [Nitrospira sp.]